MKGNLGATDRLVRTAIGAGMVGIGLLRGRRFMGLLGLYPLITGITGTCPVYKALGISTNKDMDDEMVESFEESTVEVAAP
ncbi:MAG TPA: DUF2892 domain-containing protein [bacterium]|jgi:hypothetical protein